MYSDVDWGEWYRVARYRFRGQHFTNCGAVRHGAGLFRKFDTIVIFKLWLTTAPFCIRVMYTKTIQYRDFRFSWMFVSSLSRKGNVVLLKRCGMSLLQGCSESEYSEFLFIYAQTDQSQLTPQCNHTRYPSTA